MLVQEAITGLKEKYVRSYVNYLHALTGALYDDVLNAPFFRTSNLQKFLYSANLAKGAIHSESASIKQDMKRLVDTIPYYPEPEHKEIVSAFILSLSEEVVDGFSMIATKDAKQLYQFALEIQMSFGASEIVGNPIKSQQEIAIFTTKRLHQLTRNGARYRSERYISTLVNWNLHRAYNELFVYLANAHGHQYFRAVNRDSISHVFGYDEFFSDEIQQKLFHPNSNRVVELFID